MASSETEIANAALLFLGHMTITNFEENSKAARLAKATYALLRDAELRNHPWNFAAARVSITSTGTAPTFRWSAAYTIPADSLKIKRVNYQDPEHGSWVIEGQEILTDLGTPIEVEYTRKVTAVGEFDASFTEALSLRLATRWAEPLASATSLKDSTRQDLAEVLQNARTSDGQESSATLFDEGSWLTHRSGW